MKTLDLALTVLAGGLLLACSGSDHRIGGTGSPVSSGGAAGETDEGAGGVGGTANATGGGPATGGVGGGVATGGGPATGGVGGSVGHTGGVGGGTATGGAGGGPYGPGCHEDADCRLFSYLCTGCDCVVLGANDPDPHCSGPGVQCLVDPCMDQTPVCYMGTCQIETTSGCITQAGGEICNNEVDDDCNGLVDEGCTP